MPDELRKVLLTGIVLGITAAAVVWFLERFETRRLHAEIRGYMENYDAFREFLARRGQDGQQ